MVKHNIANREQNGINVQCVFNDSSIKWRSVSLSDILSHGKRLEASVFDVQAKQAKDTISRVKYKTSLLGGENGLIETAYYPGWMQRSRLKRIWCEQQYGEGFYLPSQITDIYPVAEKHISRLADCDLDELRLKRNTLLLTRSGTIGSISIVSETLNGLVFSDDVIRISFKNACDLGYVYAFLKSKVGNLVLRTNGYGSVITHIEPEHLAEIKIPDAPPELKEQIHELVMRSYSLRDESNTLIDEAEDILIEELQLPKIWEFNLACYRGDAPVETYGVKLSSMNGRVDASYHKPIVAAITQHLNKHADEVTKVGDKRISNNIILPGRFKRVYVDEERGVPFFSGRSIGELDPSDKKYLSLSQHDRKIKNELTIHEGMILITCSGTIGNVAMVPKHWDGWAMTHDIIRLVPVNNMVGFIYIWLHSKYAETLLKAQAYGSVVSHIEKEHLLNIPVPLLKNRGAQREINHLAISANVKRYEAFKLEKQALKIIEDEVIYAK